MMIMRVLIILGISLLAVLPTVIFDEGDQFESSLFHAPVISIGSN